MKKIFTLFFSIVLAANLQAQLNNYGAGDVVPDFTVTDLEGNEHSLYEYTSAGKYVILDFFAYWCGPCMATAPTINEFYHMYGCNQGDVVVIGLEYEGTDAQTHTFEASAGIDDDEPYPTASGIDGGAAEVHATYGAAAFPTIVAITPENVIIDNDVWPIADVNTIINTFPANSINPMACALSVSQVSENGTLITMNPNPAELNTTIRAAFETNMGTINITVYNQMGQIVINENWSNVSYGNNQYNLNTSSLNTGLYHVNFSHQGKNISTQKLVVR